MRAVRLPSVLWLAIAAWPAMGAGRPAEPVEVAPESMNGTRSEPRDPFAAPDLEFEEHDAVSPLERFTLRELRLVATIDGVNPPRALIEDPSGLGFIAIVGTTVGTERHRIVSIARGEVVLETSSTSSGSSGSRVVLSLTRGSENGKLEEK